MMLPFGGLAGVQHPRGEERHGLDNQTLKPCKPAVTLHRHGAAAHQISSLMVHQRAGYFSLRSWRVPQVTAPLCLCHLVHTRHRLTLENRCRHGSRSMQCQHNPTRTHRCSPRWKMGSKVIKNLHWNVDVAWSQQQVQMSIFAAAKSLHTECQCRLRDHCMQASPSVSHRHAVSAFSRATVPSGGFPLVASSSRTVARLSRSMPPSSQGSACTPPADSSRRVGSAVLASAFGSMPAAASAAAACAPGMCARCGMGDRV
jgi:hypothetical protein